MPPKSATAKAKSAETYAPREARDRRRERFMAGAAEVFAERGFHQATMDQVAARLGVSKIILYRYFVSKDDLISSILDRVVQRCLKVNYRPSPDEFGSGVRDALKGARENPHAFLMLLRHAPHDPSFGHYYDTVFNDILEHMEQEIKKTPYIKDILPKIVRLSAETASVFALRSLTWWMEHGKETDDEQFICWDAGTIASLLDPKSLMNHPRITRRSSASRSSKLEAGKARKKR